VTTIDAFMMVHYHGRWYLNASLPTLYNLQKVPMVECSVYKSLRRKCDALHEDEREELVNEAFALMDSSAAAHHAAEIEDCRLKGLKMKRK